MSTVQHLHKTYVRGSEKRAIVQLVTVVLCHLTTAVIRGTNIPCNKVYLNTRVLKHIYDKRTAEEYDFLIHCVATVVKYPRWIYKNKDGKRGAWCFVAHVKNSLCLVSLETIHTPEGALQCEVVTFFRTDEAYLKNYELLWEWEGGTPPS